MAVVDQLLNLIGLLLWLAWRGAGGPPPSRGAGTLLSNLKPAETTRGRRWGYLAALLGLLAVRPLLYSTLAGNFNWTPLLSLGSTTLAFRADYVGRLFAHSLLSFSWAWLVMETWLLFLILMATLEREADGWTRLLRELSGWMARLPGPVSLLMPTLLAAAGWAAATFPLTQLGVLPSRAEPARLALEAGLIGLSLWLSLKWLLCGILLLRLIHTYVYFGSQPIWDFINRVGGLLIRPLQWLPVRFGKLDFTPLAAAALIWFAWWALELGLARAFAQIHW